ncbi:MAG: arginine deiminase family protein [Pseudomonadota bacterium]
MYGLSSMTAPLKRVALRRPGPAMLSADPQKWHYGPTFDPQRIGAIHDTFAGLLEKAGVETLWMSGDDQGFADAVFTYDASLMTRKGAILLSPGKLLRAGEQDLHRRFYDEHQIAIVGEITGDGRAEGGDTLWVDDTTLAVGRGVRTNQAGIDQLSQILGAQGVQVLAYDLPLYQGEAACLHLMSIISPVAEKTALIYAPLMPVAFWQLLKDKGYRLLEAPIDEFEASGGLNLNVLAVAPGHCIMIDGYPQTRALMESAGVEVQVFEGTALCVACEGGPTCMTRPILRG